MPFLKHKKGALGGITAYMFFGIFIFIANLAFYLSKEAGLLSTDDWLEGSIVSTLFVFGGMILYYIFSNNAFNQGKKAGLLELGD